MRIPLFMLLFFGPFQLLAADKIKITRDTFLKTVPASSAQVRELWFQDPNSSNFCLVELQAGSLLTLRDSKIVSSLGHGFLRLAAPKTSIEFPGCSLSEGYLPTNDFVLENPPITTIPDEGPVVVVPDESVQTELEQTPLILLYHDVVLDQTKIKSDSDVTAASLRVQLRSLKERGYTFITLDSYLAAIDKGQTPPSRSIILTFDDGYIGNFQNAVPILKEFSAPATFFIHTNYVGEQSGAKPHMDWNQLQSLERDPLFQVESHTLSHPKLTELDKPSMLREIQDSKKVLEAQLRKKVKFLAYPFGAYNKSIRATSAKSYRLAFAVENKSGQVDRFTIPRLSVGRSNMELEKFLQSLDIWTARFL